MKPVIVTPKPNDEREDQFQNQGNILVVNPNSNPRVTAAISGAASRFRLGGGPSIECIDIPGAPFGIESQRDSDRVAPYLARLAAEREGLAGFVIACFCDPGLVGCREAVSYPVWGMGESAMAVALSRADRVGVIALSQGSMRRHDRMWRRLGFHQRIAGEVAIAASVDESAGAAVIPMMADAGRRLAAMGAEVIVLGCAGMSRHRRSLETTLGLPVIDPVEAVLMLALGQALVGGSHPRLARPAPVV